MYLLNDVSYLYAGYLQWLKDLKDDIPVEYVHLDTFTIAFYKYDVSYVGIITEGDQNVGMVYFDWEEVEINGVFITVRVPHTYLRPKWRKIGLSSRIYTWASTRWILLASSQHSFPASLLWRSLIKKLPHKLLRVRNYKKKNCKAWRLETYPKIPYWKTVGKYHYRYIINNVGNHV